MILVIYLAGSLAFLFLFFLSMQEYSDNNLFQFLGYACLLISFFFLLMGIRDYTEGKKESMWKKTQERAERQPKYRAKIRERIDKNK